MRNHRSRDRPAHMAYSILPREQPHPGTLADKSLYVQVETTLKSLEPQAEQEFVAFTFPA